jgi:TM2 domain-containing membrane protein YozV
VSDGWNNLGHLDASASDSVFTPAGAGPVGLPAEVADDDVFAPATGGPTSPAPAAEDVFPTAAPSPPTASDEAVFAPAGSSQVAPAAHAAAAGVWTALYTGPAGGSAATSGGAKSKLVAGLLAVLLGWLGVHRFYLGYKLIGGIMLALTVVTLGFLLPLTFLWGVAEGILIFLGKFNRDQSGRALQ